MVNKDNINRTATTILYYWWICWLSQLIFWSAKCQKIVKNLIVFCFFFFGPILPKPKYIQLTVTFDRKCSKSSQLRGLKNAWKEVNIREKKIKKTVLGTANTSISYSMKVWKNSTCLTDLIWSCGAMATMTTPSNE